MAGEKTTKDIVVIGGSYGGTSIAHHLLRHTLPILPKSANVRVVLISASSEVFCRPACPRAMLSDEAFDQTKLFVDLKTSFSQYPKESFDVIHGLVSKVDHESRTLTVKTKDGGEQTLPYYALVVASGSSTTSPLYGMNRDSTQLKDDWKALQAALPTAKRIVVVGGGPTGTETAGELAEHLNGKAGWFGSGSKAPKTEITLITSAPHLLPNLRPSIADKADGQLAKLGVKVIKSTRVTGVSPEDAGLGSGGNLTSPATVTLSDGTSLQTDLYIPATGVKPNTSFLDPLLLTDDGALRTNPATLRVDDAGPRVYCIGDAGSYARNAVPLILSAVPALGANMKRDLLLDLEPSKAGKEDRQWREDKRETQLVPIGKGGGVGAAMGWQLPGLMVWAVKGRDYFLSHTPALWSGTQWAKEG